MFQALLYASGAMGDDIDNLVNEIVIDGDALIPALYELIQNDGNDGVELDVDIVGAGQWRQQLVQGCRCGRVVTLGRRAGLVGA